MPQSSPPFAARYMRRFECIGPECEATCCAGWTVPVDRPHYQQLKRAMNGTRAERERFRAGHVAVPDGRDARRHAQLKMLPDGRCSFLSDDDRCDVHSRYGEEALCDTCAMFPRSLGVVDGRVELVGTLSCPEVARQALLRSDALELDEITLEMLPRPMISRALDGSDADPYARALDEVRGTVLATLSTDRHPLPVRLFAIAWLGQRTRGHFHRGTTTFDAAAFAAELALARDPAALLRWHAELVGKWPTGPRAGFVITHALAERFSEAAATADLRTLMRRTFVGLGFVDGDALEVDAARLLSAYHARRDAWSQQWRDRIDGLFTNYCKQYWLKSWYTESTDLLAHAQKLHLRVALQRFLLLCHPELGDPRAVDAGERLERCMVEVAYQFARAIDHDGAYVERLDELLVRLELETLAQGMFLLAF